MKNRVSILGTVYTVEIHKVSEDEHMKKNDFMGYCWYDEKLIVIPDISEKEYFDFANKKAETDFICKILRHEITHAEKRWVY